MIAKVLHLLKEYGFLYTLKKIMYKLYVTFLLGLLHENRRLSRTQRNIEEAHEFRIRHCISILVPLYNTPVKFLREMIDSVQAQTYTEWQLCLADGSDNAHGDVKQICETYAATDARISYQKLEHNLGISENTNACIRMAKGDFIALFDHDDLLHPSALYEVMRAIEEKHADLVYTDEATFKGRESHLLSVHYKPDFCMENLRANNYICHFTVFKKNILEQTGLFRKEFDGSQDYDMILRLCEKASTICHIPKVLYFWRAHKESVALNIDSKQYAIEAGRKAVLSHLERCGLKGEVGVSEGAMSIYLVDYDIKDADIQDKCTLLLMKGIQKPSERDLNLMMRHMAKADVAAVTCKIISKKERILSGGIQIENNKIKHLFQNLPSTAMGYMNRLTYASGIPVICNGCMLVRKDLLSKMIDTGKNVSDLNDWIGMSQEWKDMGYELVNECRAMTYYEGNAREYRRLFPLHTISYNDII